MERPLGHLPIFRDADLKTDLEALSPHFCKGRCAQVEAEAVKRQAEWDALSEEEKKKRQDELKQMVERLLKVFEEEANYAHQAGYVQRLPEAGQQSRDVLDRKGREGL